MSADHTRNPSPKSGGAKLPPGTPTPLLSTTLASLALVLLLTLPWGAWAALPCQGSTVPPAVPVATVTLCRGQSPPGGNPKPGNAVRQWVNSHLETRKQI